MILGFILPAQTPISALDTLAHNRDVAGLSAHLAPGAKSNPFQILRTGGAYVVGSLGWSAKSLLAPDGTTYVVFSTPIIVEDAGELLFKVNQEGKLEYVPEWDDLGVALDSHSFNLSFNLQAGSISVTDRLKYHQTGPNHGHFVFRLTPTLLVSSILDSSGKAVPFAQGGGIVAVASQGPGEKELTVSYSGGLRRPGFRQTITAKEACVSGSVWYPMIARRPTTYDIAIHAPKEWTALAQGEDVSSSVSGEERVTKFKMDLPVVWFSATAGPYKSLESVIHGRRYFTMSTTMTKEQMALQNEHSADVIELYSDKFAPYPFKRWTCLDSEAFRGGVGALEAYSFATYPGTPGTDAHEPSHTWWGGIVDNDYLKSFWNESFADFSMMFFQQERPVGDREERRRAYVFTSSYSREMDELPLDRAGDYDGPASAVLGYVKGAAVLQVLADEIGQDLMAKAMHEFIQDNPPRRIGSWAAFEAAVDKVTGKEYGWFFDEWVRRAGMPSFSLADVSWGDGKLTGRIVFKGDPYRIHPELLMEMGDGKDRWARIDTMQTRDGDGYRFTVGCPRRPVAIAIDPWLKIPNKESRENPVQLGTGPAPTAVYGDPTKSSYFAWSRRERGTKMPDDLNNSLLIGSPESQPALKPLFDQVGFHVSGDELTYKGTTIDLTKGGAAAIVDLPGGKYCTLGIGTARVRPEFGTARLMLFDERGRMVRGATAPVDRGPLSYRFDGK